MLSFVSAGQCWVGIEIRPGTKVPVMGSSLGTVIPTGTDMVAGCVEDGLNWSGQRVYAVLCEGQNQLIN
jgi:hypothetical protein